MDYDSSTLSFELTKESSSLYRCKATNVLGSIEKIIKVSYKGK